MAEPVKVADLDDLEQEEGFLVTEEMSGYDKPIALFRTEDDEAYALDDICTHEIAHLSDGWVDGTMVECPVHSSQFCMKTGAVQCMPATEDTNTHKVELRGEEVWLYPGVPAEGADK